MFITAPGLVQHLHPSLVAPRQSCWPAITLALERHWYLLTYDVAYKGQKVSQTSLVGWDDTLLEMLARIPRADLRGIARLERRLEPDSSWALHWIGELWAPSPSEAHTVGPLLFKLGDDLQMSDTGLLPVSEETGRRLLYASFSLSGRP